jgi:hypothetical protein
MAQPKPALRRKAFGSTCYVDVDPGGLSALRVSRICPTGPLAIRQGCVTVPLRTREPVPAWVHPYEAALDAYEKRRWGEAILLFEATIALRGVDEPSNIMIARCRDLLASPLSADWQPVVALQHK